MKATQYLNKITSLQGLITDTDVKTMLKHLAEGTIENDFGPSEPEKEDNRPFCVGHLTKPVGHKDFMAKKGQPVFVENDKYFVFARSTKEGVFDYKYQHTGIHPYEQKISFYKHDLEKSIDFFPDYIKNLK